MIDGSLARPCFSDRREGGNSSVCRGNASQVKLPGEAHGGMGAPHVEDRVVERGFQKAFAG